MRWEYTVYSPAELGYTETEHVLGYDEMQWLDRRGHEGWELVAVTTGKYYFKRLVEQIGPTDPS